MSTHSKIAIALLVAAATFTASPSQAFTYAAKHDFVTTTGSPPSGAVLKSGNRVFGVTFTGGANGNGIVWRYNVATGVYTVLHDFCGTAGCASAPVGKLVIDTAGNLYGVTEHGGANGKGVAYELVKSGSTFTYTTLYDFCATGGASCTDGSMPTTGLAYDGQPGHAYNGTDLLYGTTSAGGSSGLGTVFAIQPATPPWAEKVLHSFTGATADGRIPDAELTMRGGNLFGTTLLGGTANLGTAFEMTPGANVWTDPWTESIIYNFCYSGASKCEQKPVGVTGDGANVLVGTTLLGGNGAGTNGNGTVYSLGNPGGCSELGVPGFWCLTQLYAFCQLASCADGDTPNGNLVVDGSGNVYGTTEMGGANNFGTVFEVASGGGESVIYDWCGVASCADGSFPLVGLEIDNGGNLFSVTSQGGALSAGELVEFTNP